LTTLPPITPNNLRSDPELAILDALDHMLELAVYALVAIYPELTDSERPSWRRDDSAAGRAASHLIACSQELECAVCGYRTAILRARESEANQDLPF
jgi:hypothetical protein